MNVWWNCNANKVLDNSFLVHWQWNGICTCNFKWEIVLKSNFNHMLLAESRNCVNYNRCQQCHHEKPQQPHFIISWKRNNRRAATSQSNFDIDHYEMRGNTIISISVNFHLHMMATLTTASVVRVTLLHSKRLPCSWLASVAADLHLTPRNFEKTTTWKGKHKKKKIVGLTFKVSVHEGAFHCHMLKIFLQDW